MTHIASRRVATRNCNVASVCQRVGINFHVTKKVLSQPVRLTRLTGFQPARNEWRRKNHHWFLGSQKCQPLKPPCEHTRRQSQNARLRKRTEQENTLILQRTELMEGFAETLFSAMKTPTHNMSAQHNTENVSVRQASRRPVSRVF
jgi:hypothetical protein